MNEQYLRGYFETYVKPGKPDATFEDWVSKISTNESYKRGMFNSYVAPNKPDATFDDWHNKIFGQPAQVEQPVQVTDQPIVSKTGFETSYDPLVSLAQGGVGLAQAAVGATGLVSGGYIPKSFDWASEKLFGGTLGDLRDGLQQYKSIPLQLQEEKVQKADGFTETLKAYIENPSAIASAIVESLPSMYGGAAAGRTLIGKAGAKAAAFGEGLVSAGATAEDIRTSEEDRLLSVGQTGASVLIGALTSAFGLLGVKIAQKLKVDDVDVLMTGARNDVTGAAKYTAAQKAMMRVYKVAVGAANEAVFEEMPQSWQESILKDLSTGKTWEEAVDNAAKASASGFVLGVTMGGGANIASPISTPKVDPKEIDNEIAKTTTGDPTIDATIDTQTNEIADAIQEQSPTTLPVQPEATSSQEILEGDTQEGVQEATEQEKVDFTTLPTEFEQSPFSTNYNRERFAEKAGEVSPQANELIDKVNRGEALTESELDTLEKETGKDYRVSKEEKAEQVRDFLSSKNVNDVGRFAQEWNKHIEEKAQLQPEENRAKYIKQNQLNKADVKRIDNLLKTPKQQAFDGEKLVTTIQKSIEAVTKHFTKGKTQGVREGRKFVNEQLKKLTEVLKTSPLSRRQTAAVIRRIRNTNSFTPGSVSKLNDFIRKVVNDADYAAKVRKADSLRVKLKGIKTESLPERELIRKFKQIDPAEVDIDAYLAQAEAVANTKKKAPQIKEINEYVLSTIKDIYTKETGKSDANALDFNQLIDGITSAREADRAEARVQRLIDKFGDILSEEEIRMLAQNDSPIDEAITADVKKQKALEELRVMAKEAQAMLPEDAPIGEYGNATRDSEIYSALRTLNVDDFVDADGNINGNELKQFLRTLDRVTTNADYSTAGRYAVLAKTNADFSLFEKLKGKFKVIGDIGLIKGLSQKLASLPTYVQNVFGLADVASKFQLYSGMIGLSDANAKAVNEERSLLDQIENFKTKHPQLDTDESRFRRGLYNRLVSYSTEVDPTEAFLNNKELVEQDIETYKAAKESESAAVLERLYKPFKNARTIEEAETIMERTDPLGKQLHDMIVKRFEGYYKDLADYNYYYFGTKSPQIVNYTGERRWVKVGEEGAGLFSNDIDELSDKFGWTQDPLATKPKKTRSGFERSATVNRDKNGKIKPKVDKAGNFKVTNYNLDGVALSSIRRTQFDINAIPSMLQVRMFGKKRKAILDVMGGSDTASKIYQDIFGPDGIYDAFEKASLGRALDARKPDRFDKFASDVLARGRRLAYNLTLSGYSQIVKQSTVLINAAIKLGKNARYLNFDAFKQDAKDFLKGKSVGVREEQQSIFNIGDYIDTHAINEQVRAFGITKPSRRGKIIRGWLGGLKALTKTDAKVAEMSYLAFYRQYLRQNKLKFAGWNTEKKLEDTAGRREAHAYAKQMVDVLQTASNPAEQAKGLKGSGVGTQVLKGTLIPYGTFSLNQKMRLIGDFRALAFGNNKQKGAALTDIVATAAEITAFKTFSYGLRTLYGAGFYMVVKNMFQGLDDEGEEEAKKKVDNFWKDLYTALLIELTPTILTQPDFMQQAVAQLFNEGYYKLWNLYNPDYKLTRKEFEDEIGMPFMAMGKGSQGGIDAVLDNLGMFGAAFDSVKEIGKDVAIFADKEQEDVTDINKLLTDDQRKLALLVAVLEAGALTGIVPADVKFTARRELRKQIRQRKNMTYPTK